MTTTQTTTRDTTAIAKQYFAELQAFALTQTTAPHNNAGKNFIAKIKQDYAKRQKKTDQMEMQQILNKVAMMASNARMPGSALRIEEFMQERQEQMKKQSDTAFVAAEKKRNPKYRPPGTHKMIHAFVKASMQKQAK